MVDEVHMVVIVYKIVGSWSKGLVGLCRVEKTKV